MGSPIEQPRLAPPPQIARFDPYTGQPLHPVQEDLLDPPPPAQGNNFWAEQAQAKHAQPVYAEPPNPYAPTGWQARNRVGTDITLPSGQIANVIRLEREDLTRMNLMGYLDTFTPMLMDDTLSTEERDRRVRQKIESDSGAVASMFMAIDQVVMAACVKPKVTDNEALADYGGPGDWVNPRFIATAYIHDIKMEDRFFVFATAFGRSMDDLKSLFGEASSVASLAAESGIQ